MRLLGRMCRLRRKRGQGLILGTTLRDTKKKRLQRDCIVYREAEGKLERMGSVVQLPWV